MLIAEDLLLLLLDDKSGKFGRNSYHRQALAGAVLAELAQAGAAQIQVGNGFAKPTTVRRVDARAVSDPLLVRVAELVDEKPRSPERLVNRIGGEIERALCERLVKRGVLRERRTKFLGVGPRTRWPSADNSHEAVVRSEIRASLLDGREPSARIAVLIALLLAIDRVHRVVDCEGRSAREINGRAMEVADRGWASVAVRKAVVAAKEIPLPP